MARAIETLETRLLFTGGLTWQVQSDYFGATTSVSQPRSLRGLALSPSGNDVYGGFILNPSTASSTIREVSTAIQTTVIGNEVNTVPGTTPQTTGEDGFVQDGLQAKGLATDSRGNVYATLSTNTNATTQFWGIYNAGLTNQIVEEQSTDFIAARQLPGIATAFLGGNYYVYLGWQNGQIERWNVNNPAIPVLDTSWGNPAHPGTINLKSINANFYLDDLAVDSSGNIFIAGGIQGTTSFGDSLIKVPAAIAAGNTATSSNTLQVNVKGGADGLGSFASMKLALYEGRVYVTEYLSTDSAIGVFYQSDLSSAGVLTLPNPTGPSGLNATYPNGADSGFSGIAISSTGLVYVGEQLYNITTGTSFSPNGSTAITGNTIDFDRILVSSALPLPAISIQSGNNQSTPINTQFAQQLAVQATNAGVPEVNQPVTFTAPASGASGTFSNSTNTITVMTDSSGDAMVPFTANGTIGADDVSVSVAGASDATFALTNDEAASLVVTTDQDVVDPTDNLTSLREAINYANSVNTTSTVTFDTTVFPANTLTTILLGGSELEFSNPFTSTHAKVTIDGLGADRIAVSGNNASQTFVADGTTDVEIDGLTITGGSGAGAVGGGIASDGVLVLNDDVITGNSAGTGGGIAASFGTLTIFNTTVAGNTANQAGGIFLSDESAAISDSTISGNSAVDTGGLRLDASSASPTLAIVNTTISGNTASGSTDAGVRIAANNGKTAHAYLADDTISNNSMTNAGNGGINVFTVNGGNTDVFLEGTIVSGNTANGSESDLAGSFDTGSSDNLVGSGGNLTNGVNNNQVGVDNPLLAPLGNYGGDTQTQALLPGSPAIDAGGDFTDANGQPITTDQRGTGFSRKIGGTSDIGAFESGGFTIAAVPADATQSTVQGTAFANPLGVTVTAKTTGEPVKGGVITYTPPPTGASAVLSSTTATIATDGSASVTATANSTVGSYSVSASAFGIAAATSFALTNTSASTNVQIDAPTITYGGTGLVTVTVSSDAGTPTGSVSLSVDSGMAISQTLSSGSTTFSLNGLPAGDHTLSASYAAQGVFAANSNTGTLHVNQATANVSVTNYSVTYNANPHTAMGTATGIGGADLSTDLDLSGTTHTNAGTYASDGWSFHDPEGNYADKSGTVSDSIGKATPTVTVSDPSGPYTGSPFTASGMVKGVGTGAAFGTSLEGVSPTFTYYMGSTATGTPLGGAQTATGTYTVVAKFAGSMDYIMASSTPATFTIGRATTVIHASDPGGSYTGQPFPATGFVYVGTTVVATPTFTYYNLSDKTQAHPLAGAPVNVGSYYFVATYAGSANYLPTTTSSGPITITKGQPVIHASDLGGPYNAKAYPASGFAYIGTTVVGTPTFKYYNLSDTSESHPLSGAPINPGSYFFTASFAGNSNLNSTSTSSGPFNITIPVTSFTVSSIHASTGATFNGVVAQFSAPSGLAASYFSATINWGDGTTTTGTVSVTATKGKYQITGSHKWTKSGPLTLTITLTPTATAALTAKATTT